MSTESFLLCIIIGILCPEFAFGICMGMAVLFVIWVIYHVIMDELKQSYADMKATYLGWKQWWKS